MLLYFYAGTLRVIPTLRFNGEYINIFCYPIIVNMENAFLSYLDYNNLIVTSCSHNLCIFKYLCL